jgi:uncharacterized phage protein (TIGR01671 family)
MKIREFKFRCWHYSTEEFSYVNFDTGFMGCFVGSSHVEGRNQYQQFTGLKDKDGKDVYEGDILDDISYDQRYVITWSENFGFLYPRIAHWQENKITNDEILSLVKYNEHIKHGYVIGNIFQNQELLN